MYTLRAAVAVAATGTLAASVYYLYRRLRAHRVTRRAAFDIGSGASKLLVADVSSAGVVIVDECEHCKGIWLDSGEIGRLIELHQKGKLKSVFNNLLSAK